MKLISLFILFTIVSACGPTTTGNPISRKQVTLRMEDQQPFAFLKKTSDWMIPEAKAAVSDTKFCFKRLRFKPDSTTNGSNFELLLGQVDIDPAGTNLLTVSVPEGTYERIEFDLEDDCNGTPGTPSVIFTNGNGTFNTTENMTIKFDGSYTVSAAGTLTLNIDALFDAMDLITANNQIKTSLENAPGDF